MFWLKSIRSACSRSFGPSAACTCRPTSAFSASKAMACVTSRSRCRASRYSFRGSLTLKSSARSLSASIYNPKRGLSKVPRERGGLHTPTCCPKKELALASLDAGRPAHLLVLRPPLGLPGLKCVQPGLEALAHPPQQAGEVRVVEGDHLGAVAPPGGARQVLPLRS